MVEQARKKVEKYFAPYESDYGLGEKRAMKRLLTRVAQEGRGSVGAEQSRRWYRQNGKFLLYRRAQTLSAAAATV